MMDESKLIFIISQPRSGSTLLQKLISNNNLVDTVSEPWLLLPLLGMFQPGLINAKYNYPVALKGFFDYLQKKNVEGEFKEELKKLILNLYKVSDSSHFFVDKTPRYYEIIPQMMEMFPAAKFLVLKRNPFASLHSMLSTWSGGKVDYQMFSTFYRDFLVAPFNIQDFCKKNTDNPNVLEVKYEDIVSQPEIAVKNIYQWLTIPFDMNVLKLEGNEKVKGIFGDDVYKKEPLSEIKSALSDSWRSSLSNKEVVNFYSDYQDYLSPGFIREYGYDTEEFKNGSSLFKKNTFTEYIESLKKANQI